VREAASRDSASAPAILNMQRSGQHIGVTRIGVIHQYRRPSREAKALPREPCCVSTTRTIRIPVHIVEKLNRIGRAERKLMMGLGREPTAEEIAEVTGIESDEVDSIRRSAQAPISLEKPVGDEEQTEFGQLIADEQAESPYERAVEALTTEALRDALENLSYRERRVMDLRYGLGDEHPRTLDEIGRTFNVTRERIRQIERQSLNKLQSLRETQRLRDDIDIAFNYSPRPLKRHT